MNDIYIIVITGILFFAATLPFVIAFDKAKREMEAEEREESNAENR